MCKKFRVPVTVSLQYRNVTYIHPASKIPRYVTYASHRAAKMF